MRSPILYFSFFVGFMCFFMAHEARAQKTFTFPSQDGLTITGDLYQPDSAGQPKTVVVMFHQAGSSRGEYKHIGPVLADLGYMAMAVDLRAGELHAGVQNKTADLAEKKLMPTGIFNAVPDMIASIAYAHQELRADRIILWGSSFSASFAFLIAGQTSLEVEQGAPQVIDGVIAFSPAEHFNFNPPVFQVAKSINVPVFISSARHEQKDWNTIFNMIRSQHKINFIPNGMGAHGSMAFSSRAKDEYWTALKSFLSDHFSFEASPSIFDQILSDETSLQKSVKHGPTLLDESANQETQYWSSDDNLDQDIEDEDLPISDRWLVGQ